MNYSSKARWGALAALVGTFALALTWTAPAHSQRPPLLDTLPRELVKRARVSEEAVARLLNTLGPAVREQLANGRDVTLPGLGVFRVVRVPEHRNLVDGRPTTIPARNTVEFLPDGGISAAANNPQARPAATVQPFEYNILPGQTPSQRAPSTRLPSSRIR